jgi:hypothetical protein
MSFLRNYIIIVFISHINLFKKFEIHESMVLEYITVNIIPLLNVHLF